MSQLEFLDKRRKSTPEVLYTVQAVGYGDDRYHSDTVDMLRKITETYGGFESFTGASIADKIVLDLTS